MNKIQNIKALAILLIIAIKVNTKLFPANRNNQNSSPTIKAASTSLTNNNTVMTLGNSQNYLYYINFNVGTQPQVMGVQVDTGSNILWLPIQGSGAPKYFNTTKSSTFTNTQNTGSIQYADGSGVAGTFGNDIVTITSTPINENGSILWVNQMVDMTYPNTVQGLVGMGYTTTPNFLDIAYQNGEISTSAFALQIRKNTSTSYFYYNKIPEQITSSSYYLPVVGNEYWQIKLIGVMVGSIDMTRYAAKVAIIDSGTSYFYLNQNLFNKIISSYFSDCNNNLSPAQCPCSSVARWPTFTFMFEGIETYIQPNQYTTNNTQSCTYNFGTLQTVSEVLLGDIFFQGYTITFNKLTSTIGFSGNLGYLQSVGLVGSQIAEYVFLGIIGIIMIIGMIAYCSLQKTLSSSSQLMLSETTNRNIYQTSPSYQLGQRFI